ncbi:MAG: SAM-dependent chlorinase/fluorinase [Hydrogenothermaceae bacterium]
MKKNIALLTDFGNKDGFVGAVKGVIISINPEVNLIDISHEVEPFNILEASLILNAVYRYFPKGTIFLSVVDPGVGTERKAVIIETEDYIFVSPDNGLLTLPLKNQTVKKIVYIKNSKYFLPTNTNTFHGRDIFAPVCGYISLSEPLENFGEIVSEYIKILDFEPVYTKEKIFGKIIKFDRFGNAITNIDKLPERFRLVFKGYEITKVCKNFLEGERGKPNLIMGSFGFYELFIPEESLKDKLNLQISEPVEVYLV